MNGEGKMKKGCSKQERRGRKSKDVKDRRLKNCKYKEEPSSKKRDRRKHVRMSK
jgi:hypothetical protein